jgi:hypothetical protein
VIIVFRNSAFSIKKAKARRVDQFITAPPPMALYQKVEDSRPIELWDMSLWEQHLFVSCFADTQKCATPFSVSMSHRHIIKKN